MADYYDALEADEFGDCISTTSRETETEISSRPLSGGDRGNSEGSKGVVPLASFSSSACADGINFCQDYKEDDSDSIVSSTTATNGSTMSMDGFVKVKDLDSGRTCVLPVMSLGENSVVSLPLPSNAAVRCASRAAATVSTPRHLSGRVVSPSSSRLSPRREMVDLFNPNSDVHAELQRRLRPPMEVQRGASAEAERSTASSRVVRATSCTTSNTTSTSYVFGKRLSVLQRLAQPASAVPRFLVSKRTLLRPTLSQDLKIESQSIEDRSRVLRTQKYESQTQQSTTDVLSASSTVCEASSQQHTSLPTLITVKSLHLSAAAAAKKQAARSIWLLEEFNIPHGVPIWSLGVSRDGRFMAAGCQDGKVRIWATAWSDYGRRGGVVMSTTSKCEKDNTGGTGDTGRRTTARMFEEEVEEREEWTSFTSRRPKFALNGHDASIVALVWEPRKTNARLMTTSLDRTVRIWKPPDGTAGSSIASSQCGGRSLVKEGNSIGGTAATNSTFATDGSIGSHDVECLAVLQCSDWPTAAVFHPCQRRKLFVGCLDASVHVWDVKKLYKRGSLVASASSESQRRRQSQPAAVMDAHVVGYFRSTDLVTSMAISHRGELLAVGSRCGRVSLYEAETLKFLSEVDCKNRHGKTRYGRKVTGLCWSADDCWICVTTNDSRIRILNVNDFSLCAKFKGHVNEQIMLQAAFSRPREQSIVCGSEDGVIHIWNADLPIEHPTGPTATSGKKRPTNSSTESFRAFDDVLTTCIVAPEAFTKGLLTRLDITSLKDDRYDGLKAQSERGVAKPSRPSPSTAQHDGNFSKGKKIRSATKDETFALIAASRRGTIRVFVSL